MAPNFTETFASARVRAQRCRLLPLSRLQVRCRLQMRRVVYLTVVLCRGATVSLKAHCSQGALLVKRERCGGRGDISVAETTT